MESTCVTDTDLVTGKRLQRIAMESTCVTVTVIVTGHRLQRIAMESPCVTDPDLDIWI